MKNTWGLHAAFQMKQPLGNKTETVQINTSMHLENQLLATKFFMPKASHPLISRPRLNGLLDEGLKYPLTLICAPAGFGKTTLLASWGQSLPASNPLMAWVSLDEGEDRKSTRLNSSHVAISYAVFCLKKKKIVIAKAIVFR